MGGSYFIVIIVVFIALIYFMTIRPQRKRMDEQKALVNSLQPGTRVLLNSGIIGTIRAVGDAQLVVELAPGTEVTVLKQVIVKTLKPEDEEFEYSDETPPDTTASASGPDTLLYDSDNPALWSPDSQLSPSDPSSPSDDQGRDGTQTH
jgi:preprotein translocase subunit YajC